MSNTARTWDFRRGRRIQLIVPQGLLDAAVANVILQVELSSIAALIGPSGAANDARSFCPLPALGEAQEAGTRNWRRFAAVP